MQFGTYNKGGETPLKYERGGGGVNSASKGNQKK